MSFKGFAPEALQLLPTLSSFAEADYDRERELLVSGLRKPGIALITEVAEALPAPLSVLPRSSCSPLHRDLRFAKPGAPRYKDHLLLTTWQGSQKNTSPVLWIRIDAKSVGFASGISFTPSIREDWRNAIAAPSGEALEASLAVLAKQHARDDFEVDGEQLSRTPKPWDDSHPRSGLLRRKGFQARFIQPLPKNISTASFASWCEKRLTKLLPVHNWLAQHLGEDKDT